ncbi:MAG: HAD family hydrolase [Tannerellaceae bacterium]|jgi:D-glycero-D-manno-heptose 1,7-bisphosphate phosphatase/D-glycero-alpha-D-manno-heptose 1-phosphate guanylyltransferase|nr:HAD family hydrolase [Tannerellaceae bacterium]
MAHIKKYSTLFLDRDGVINVHCPNDYVKSVDEFVFIEGVLDAFRLLSPLFLHIIIVTNQRGVGKGLMSSEDLDRIHRYMVQTVLVHQGRIDRIYTCIDTDSNSPYRKPNTGMVLQALKDFPDITLSNSYMAGDSISDMQFADKSNIPAVLIGTKYTPEAIASLNIRAQFPDLLTFAERIQSKSV